MSELFAPVSRYGYVSMADQSSSKAVRLLRRGAFNRALRFFEHSFWLRNFPLDTPSWGCAYTRRPHPHTNPDRGTP